MKTLIELDENMVYLMYKVLLFALDVEKERKAKRRENYIEFFNIELLEETLNQIKKQMNNTFYVV